LLTGLFARKIEGRTAEVEYPTVVTATAPAKNVGYILRANSRTYINHDLRVQCPPFLSALDMRSVYGMAMIVGLLLN
jgi:hypothetical protein